MRKPSILPKNNRELYLRTGKALPLSSLVSGKPLPTSAGHYNRHDFVLVTLLNIAAISARHMKALLPFHDRTVSPEASLTGILGLASQRPDISSKHSMLAAFFCVHRCWGPLSGPPLFV